MRSVVRTRLAICGDPILLRSKGPFELSRVSGRKIERLHGSASGVLLLQGSWLQFKVAPSRCFGILASESGWHRAK